MHERDTEREGLGRPTNEDNAHRRSNLARALVGHARQAKSPSVFLNGSRTFGAELQPPLLSVESLPEERSTSSATFSSMRPPFHIGCGTNEMRGANSTDTMPLADTMP